MRQIDYERHEVAELPGAEIRCRARLLVRAEFAPELVSHSTLLLWLCWLGAIPKALQCEPLRENECSVEFFI